MPSKSPKKENIVIHFFKRNWPQISVITILLMVCCNEYIGQVLDYTSTLKKILCLGGLALGCLVIAVAVMLLLRLIEWGFTKL